MSKLLSPFLKLFIISEVIILITLFLYVYKIEVFSYTALQDENKFCKTEQYSRIQKIFFIDRINPRSVIQFEIITKTSELSKVLLMEKILNVNKQVRSLTSVKLSRHI